MVDIGITVGPITIGVTLGVPVGTTGTSGTSLPPVNPPAGNVGNGTGPWNSK